jgi:hypothetical protein
MMGSLSSRCTSVFTLRIESVEERGGQTLEKTAKLTFVDLANSARMARAGGLGTYLREASQLSKSLCALGEVIHNLADNRPYIPYRNSVLTRLLQNSLGRNSKTLFFRTIFPMQTAYLPWNPAEMKPLAL